MPFELHLDCPSGKPTHREIVTALRAAILEKRLRPGEKMPSIRELAKTLTVSPAVINRSYADLASQGYIKIVHGRGAFLSDRIPYILSLPDWSVPESAADGSENQLPTSEYGLRLSSENVSQRRPSLHFSAPLMQDLPVTRWRELLRQAVKFEDPALLAYESDPMGYWPLRQAIAEYLGRARSVKCSAEQVAVFTHVEAGTDLITRILIRPGDAVAVEDPCAEVRRQAIRLQGAKVLGVPVDADGMQVEKLYEMENSIRLVQVLPSHHEPSGVALSLSRRESLLQWAHQRNAFVLENDFDCEYYFDKPYIQSMQGMDENQSVIYRYTFWRVLYPLVRMSILVLPMRLVNHVERAKRFLGETPLLEQKALAGFITSGLFDRQIQHCRALYAARRAAMIEALTKHFGKLDFSTSGMHLLLSFPETFTRQAILEAGAESGLVLAESSHYYYQVPPPANEFLIGFAYLESAAAIADAVEQFAAILNERGSL